MQVRCVRPFGTWKPGDVSEVPDGAGVSPWYWEPVTAGAPAAAAVPAPLPVPQAPAPAPDTAKEGA